MVRPPSRGTSFARAIALLLPLVAGCSCSPSPSPGVTSAISADHPRVRSLPPRPVPDPAGPDVLVHPSFATDVALRIQEVQARFGPSTRVQVEGAFVLADPQHASFFPEEASTVRRTVASLAAGPFPKPLERPVTVIIFGSRAAFATYSKDRYGMNVDRPQVWAYFFRTTREIAVDGMSGLHSLTHELLHPYIAQDWKHAPAWVDEGIASQFEAPVWDPDGQMHGVRNWRYDGLVDELQAARSTASPVR